MGSNRILPLISGAILLMLLFVGIKSCHGDKPDASQLLAVPVPGSPDADSPADTIRTLTAEVASIKHESKKLNQQNEALLRQRNAIEATVKAELLQAMKDENTTKELPINGLTQQLDFFKSRLDELSQAQNKSALKGAGEDIPVGFGLDQESLPAASPAVIWVEPLNASHDAQGTVSYPASVTHSVKPTEGLLNSEPTVPADSEKYLTASTPVEIEKDRPAYTVPRNSTLIGSTGMTAMIGRIPRNGTVEDPFPFKVIVGKDNLAANGFEMPGLDGMIFSGKATGDWTLSCVRGALHSVTSVFADGTIRTLSSDDQSQSSQGQGESQRHARDLGWISDRRGIPCVSGERISNAASYLSGRLFASAAEAAAEAFSQEEVTNTVSALGGVSTSVVTGDAVRFAGGKALAGGASEVSDYLRERGAQAFDVIYVDTGVELAIHIDIELPIDYEYQGRKTHYGYNENTDYDGLD